MKRILALLLIACNCQAAIYSIKVNEVNWSEVSAGLYIATFAPVTPAPTSDLVLEYLFGANGSESSITLDTSGNNYTGTVVNAVWSSYTNGLAANYDFDGSGDYIQATNAIYNSLATNVNQIIVSGWYNLDTTSGNDGLWTFGDLNNSQGEFDSHFFSDVLYVDLREGPNSRGANVAFTSVDTWKHIACVLDAPNSMIGIYVDGTLAVSSIVNVADHVNLSGNEDFNWGAYYGTGFTLDGSSALGYISTNPAHITASAILATNRYQAVQLGIASKASYDLSLDPVFDMTSNGNGATPQDGSTNAIALTLANLAEYDLGYTNAATTYNGSTSDAQLPVDQWTAAEIAIGSIVAWARTDTYDYGGNRGDIWNVEGRLILHYNDAEYGTADRWAVTINDGSIVTSSSSNQPPLDIWQQVVATWDGTNQNLYINGILEDSDAQGSPAIDAFSRNSNVGSSFGGGARNFSGEIDDVKFYTTLLNQSDIATLYTNESTLFGNPSYWQSIPQYDSLVAFYPFNAGESKDWSDVGRGGNDGSDTDVSYVGFGHWDGNGSTSRTTADDSSLPTGNTARTVSFWINSDDAATAAPLQYGTSSAQQRYQIGYISGTPNKLQLDINNHQMYATNTLITNTWTHIALVYDGTTITSGSTFYVDGVPKISVQGAGSDVALNTVSSGTLSIGSTLTPSAYVNGSLDDVLIFNTALTSNEVFTLYNLGHNPQ